MKVSSALAAVLFAATTSLALMGTANAADDKPAPVHTGAADTVESGVGSLACASPAHSNKDTRSGRFFDAGNVNIRRGPHTSSCTSDGQGQLTHNVDYHCWALGDSVTRNGSTYTTWTYLRDTTTGVQGWVSDAYLDLNSNGLRGSLVAC
ncbi:hypothetical protein [Nocardia sp. NRRL S-836]|uniref:hypothetical protein n=1 Tax=Nocardia sp. NRRL S-836 TaxID=1519492 RepID=UPI0006BEF82E|nr:hypothetical protein [Nocardia sp. NRRL S-836]KOV84533.1 hypothetical protein ADL03_16920 [Nocardia sp. NRRL S-836]